MERLYFVDRLRFLALVLLIFYHTALIFAAQSNFPIKNGGLSWFAEDFCFFVHGWRLAVLFFISGLGTRYLIMKSTGTHYLKSRLKRLLVPLLFGVIVIVPPQIYFERLSQGFEYPSFFEFYTQSFSKGFYPYGDISWHHLWFVAYLLIYSLVSIPLFRILLKFKSGNKQSGWKIIIWALPLVLVSASLKPYSLGVQNIVDDLAMFSFYWLIFLAGFVTSQGIHLEYLKARRFYLLVAAIICSALVYFLRDNFLFEKGKVQTYGYDVLRAFNTWLWVLSLLGTGIKYLNYQSGSLKLLNESVYPVYILHQTVLICMGYFVVQMDLSIGTKFMIIATGTIVICYALFFLIRMTNTTRTLFGMAPVLKIQLN